MCFSCKKAIWNDHLFEIQRKYNFIEIKGLINHMPKYFIEKKKLIWFYHDIVKAQMH